MPRKTRKMLVGKATENTEQQDRESMYDQLARELHREWRQARRDGAAANR
jgi:hypothetical protein